ncbi:MAG: hypothetical protein AVDCRST_MAG03-434 [uncultured Rubrobacteraceae bacterium]|uniref:Uncharacterized protein n=1 Tax=uncultured Rubrobacteraceae bacterium TaxID=349277 RepID=A0A6J4NHZ7_9ACTN|nr:MAG: hypothetical protein AVDCRST_MAG03-434 [uncultured Rubrobacteraceae bacterium]
MVILVTGSTGGNGGAPVEAFAPLGTPARAAKLQWVRQGPYGRFHGA